MRLTAVLFVVVCLLLGAGRVAGISAEPTGFQNLKFGASIEEARKLYPTMEKIERSKIGPAAKYPPKVQRFFVAKQRVTGLDKATDIEFMFWDNRFWLAMVRIGDNDPEKVEQLLRQRHGEPSYVSDPYVGWTGKAAAVLLDRKTKYFEMHDENISNEARREIFKGLLATGNVLSPPTPEASPARTAEGGASPAPAETPTWKGPAAN